MTMLAKLLPGPGGIRGKKGHERPHGKPSTEKQTRESAPYTLLQKTVQVPRDSL